MTSDSDKYQLRPRAPRGRPERARQPAPLSKYRRRTANARERSRMREINGAFEALRRAVPAAPGAAAPCEKLTKITTLRLAMRYIAALSAALGERPATPPPPPSPDGWPTYRSDLSEFSADLQEAPSSDFTEDSLTPFETFLEEFNYIETFV